MLSTFISLGVVTLLIRSAAGQDTCYTAHSVSDYALTGHAYKTTSGFRLMTCIVACDDDPNCYSLGYNIPSKTCELSRKTRRSDPASFSFRPNWLYLDHPVRPAGACVGDLPCKNRGRCQNVPHSPGYKCTCRQPYIGETCEGMMSQTVNNGSRESLMSLVATISTTFQEKVSMYRWGSENWWYIQSSFICEPSSSYCAGQCDVIFLMRLRQGEIWNGSLLCLKGLMPGVFFQFAVPLLLEWRTSESKIRE